MAIGGTAPDLSELDEAQLNALADQQLGDRETLEQFSRASSLHIEFMEKALNLTTPEDLRPLLMEYGPRFKAMRPETFSPGTLERQVKEFSTFVRSASRPEERKQLENARRILREAPLLGQYATLKEFRRAHEELGKSWDTSFFSMIKSEEGYRRLRSMQLRPSTPAAREISQRHWARRCQTTLEGWLGLRVARFQVEAVRPSSAADSARLLKGDRLCAVEHHLLHGGSASELLDILESYAEGTTVKISLARKDTSQTIKLVLPSRPSNIEDAPPPPSGKELKNKTLAMMAAVDSALEMFKLDWGEYPPVATPRALSDLLTQGGGPEQWERLRRLLSTLSTKTDQQLQNMFTGPYLKLQEGRPFLQDAWGGEFHFRLDPVKGTYLLYSDGPNGKDDGGTGDDILSEGSTPPPSKVK